MNKEKRITTEEQVEINRQNIETQISLTDANTTKAGQNEIKIDNLDSKQTTMQATLDSNSSQITSNATAINDNTDAINNITGSLVDQSYVDAGDADTLANSKVYTDGEIAKVKLLKPTFADNTTLVEDVDIRKISDGSIDIVVDKNGSHTFAFDEDGFTSEHDITAPGSLKSNKHQSLISDATYEEYIDDPVKGIYKVSNGIEEHQIENLFAAEDVTASSFTLNGDKITSWPTGTTPDVDKAYVDAADATLQTNIDAKLNTADLETEGSNYFANKVAFGWDDAGKLSVQSSYDSTLDKDEIKFQFDENEDGMIIERDRVTGKWLVNMLNTQILKTAPVTNNNELINKAEMISYVANALGVASWEEVVNNNTINEVEITEDGVNIDSVYTDDDTNNADSIFYNLSGTDDEISYSSTYAIPADTKAQQAVFRVKLDVSNDIYTDQTTITPKYRIMDLTAPLIDGYKFDKEAFSIIEYVKQPNDTINIKKTIEFTDVEAYLRKSTDGWRISLTNRYKEDNIEKFWSDRKLYIQNVKALTLGGSVDVDLTDYYTKTEIDDKLALKVDKNNEEVAIGVNAGETSQGDYATAIGINAGQNNQGINTVAIGSYAGQDNQSQYALAFGDGAGYTGQGRNATAIGVNAGRENQGAYALAIGNGAGYDTQPQKSIHIAANDTRATVPLENQIKFNAGTTEVVIDSNGIFINGTKVSV